MLTRDRAQELLTYDKTTGKLFWRFTLGRMVEGKEAGCVNKGGYRVVRVDKRPYMAHAIVWLMETGDLPSSEIDHKDRNPANNRIKNLRVASRSQNLRNTGVSKNNRLGVKGVFAHQKGFRSVITCNGVRIDLGTFTSAENAAIAYVAAEKVCVAFFG